MKLYFVFALTLAAGCGSTVRGRGDGGLNLDNDGGDGSDGGQAGCAGVGSGCYTVYAHSDHVLYRIDLQARSLVEVGPFHAPTVGSNEDVITDLAVAPDDQIYGISNTNLYNVDSGDGHVTLIGPVTACGQSAVALTFDNQGKLYAADFKGAFCGIDISQSPPKVTNIGTLGNGLAISGDLVAVGDGTMYGTAYKTSDPSGSGTQANNLLVKIDPASGVSLQTLGSTGFGRLFGVAFAMGQVFGFTHDGTGDVVTIDPKTGKGTLYNSFNDPSTGMGLSFAGAAVNSKVSPIM